MTGVDSAGVRIALDAGGGSDDTAIPVRPDATPRATLASRSAYDRSTSPSGRSPEAALQLAATIERSEQLGASCFLYCRLGNGDTLTVHVPGQLAHRSGDVIAVAIPVGAAMLFDVGEGERALPRRASASG